MAAAAQPRCSTASSVPGNRYSMPPPNKQPYWYMHSHNRSSITPTGQSYSLTACNKAISQPPLDDQSTESITRHVCMPCILGPACTTSGNPSQRMKHRSPSTARVAAAAAGIPQRAAALLVGACCCSASVMWLCRCSSLLTAASLCAASCRCAGLPCPGSTCRKSYCNSLATLSSC